LRTAFRLRFAAVDSASTLAAPSDLEALEGRAVEPLSCGTPRVPGLVPVDWAGFEALLAIQITTERVNITTMIPIVLGTRRM
jgi:hypothetical protein